MRVIFFGVLEAGVAGHFTTEVGKAGKYGYYSVCGALGVKHIDAVYPPRDPREPQGAAALHKVNGWTVLAWWDRTGDSRRGSNSALIVEGDHTADRMAELLREHFPDVARRQPDPWPDLKN